ALIATNYAVMLFEELLPPKEAYTQLEAAVTTALRLDPGLAEAHADLGLLKWARDWDPGTAENEFRRAIALAPQHPDIRRSYVVFLRGQRRWDEALDQMKQVRSYDALSTGTNTTLAYTYYWAGRYDEAIAAAQQALTLDPNHIPAHQLLAEAYARKRRY